MFFGGVEGVVRREWRRQFVTVDLRSVPVDVDVEPLLGHVMGGFSAPSCIVIIPNDGLPDLGVV